MSMQVVAKWDRVVVSCEDGGCISEVSFNRSFTVHANLPENGDEKIHHIQLISTTHLSGVVGGSSWTSLLVLWLQVRIE